MKHRNYALLISYVLIIVVFKTFIVYKQDVLFFRIVIATIVRKYYVSRFICTACGFYHV